MAAKIFVIKCFDPTVLIAKSSCCCREVPDDRFEVQNDPTCTNIGFSISALSRDDGIWRKGTAKLETFMQSPGSLSEYLAMQGKLLCRATTSMNGRIVNGRIGEWEDWPGWWWRWH